MMDGKFRRGSGPIQWDDETVLNTMGENFSGKNPDNVLLEALDIIPKMLRGDSIPREMPHAIKKLFLKFLEKIFLMLNVTGWNQLF